MYTKQWEFEAELETEPDFLSNFSIHVISCQYWLYF